MSEPREIGRLRHHRPGARGNDHHQDVREEAHAVLRPHETGLLELVHAREVRGEEDVGGSPRLDLPGEVARAAEVEGHGVSTAGLEAAPDLPQGVGQAGRGEDEHLLGPGRPGREPPGDQDGDGEGPGSGRQGLLRDGL